MAGGGLVDGGYGGARGDGGGGVASLLEGLGLRPLGAGWDVGSASQGQFRSITFDLLR